MKKTFLLPVATFLAMLTQSSCVTTNRDAVEQGLYKDPDTKRLEMQEEMTRITRELSTNY